VRAARRGFHHCADTTGMAGTDHIQKCDRITFSQKSSVAVSDRATRLEHPSDTDMTGNQWIRDSRQLSMPEVDIGPTDFGCDGSQQNTAGFHGRQGEPAYFDGHTGRGYHSGSYGAR
jgi:hypothetical protein